MRGHTYRVSAGPAPLGRTERAASLDVEVVVFIVSLIGVAAGLARGAFGALETVAFLGLVLSSRALGMAALRAIAQRRGA